MPATACDSHTLLVILGNQLFPRALLRDRRRCRVFMAEDIGLCTYVRHHKQKIAMFLAAMRAYADELRSAGFDVHYERLDDSAPGAATHDDYEAKLARFIRRVQVRRIEMWEIEDKFFESRMRAFAAQVGLELSFRPSPMFVTSREEFTNWLRGRRPHMAAFYQWQRRRLGMLVDQAGEPVGGRWSFDSENRQKLPRDQPIPPPPRTADNPHLRQVVPLVLARFGDHPGELSVQSWWLPTTRREALDWLRRFLAERLDFFGPYEDALSSRDPVLFHSVLTPALNLGLITPQEVLDECMSYAAKHDVRPASLEGFVRQIVGWREFVRGVYQRFSDEQEQRNFFGHRRRLSAAWYTGTTGLAPLDDVIHKALRFGWTHHIERLMIVGNLMTLCEILPSEAYRWFMEMYVDSSDWVMAPNVYGMGIFSDGGVFATKPYICGSNYIRKMSDSRASREKSKRAGEGLFAGDAADHWCEIMDGLYWRFVDKHRTFFRGQARMAQMVAALDRLQANRRRRLFAMAEQFIERVTSAPQQGPDSVPSRGGT